MKTRRPGLDGNRCKQLLLFHFDFFTARFLVLHHRGASRIRLRLSFSSGRVDRFHMTDTTEGLPMDVAEEARLQQQQQQQDEDHNKELHRNDSVRARLLAISQVEPVGEVLPLDALKDTKGAPSPTHPPADNEDEFRRKLVSISYVDVPMSAQ